MLFEKPPIKYLFEEEDLQEKFVKGQGSGGQKINKASNRVVLVHIPTGLKVECQDARDLSTNRKWARGMLNDKLDLFYNGTESKLGKKQEQIRKRKKNSARRSKKKYVTKEDNVDKNIDQEADQEDLDEILQLVAERIEVI